MVFKLLRIDETDARKIPMVVGKHLIGRGSGKFLQCDDKRVSRQHGELEVTDNSVTLKALHTNPCFYLRKGTFDRTTLNQNESVSLGNGDKFGLLPADCWYEIIYLPDSENDKDKQETTGQISDSNRTAMLDCTEANIDTVVDRSLWYPSIISEPPSENVNDVPQIDDRPASPNVMDQSQSLLQNGDLPLNAPSNPSPILQSQLPQTPNQSNSFEHQPMKFKIEPPDRDSVQPNPPKRPLPSTSTVKTEPSDEVKRIKTEPDESFPGSSHAQNGDQDGSAPGPSDGAAPPQMPPSPAKPARPRERCMYGANCYRKNEDHKKQFSHPSDPDWGSGDRGVCPYGAGCVRRHPTHWAQNEHPPGTLPPAQRPQGKRQRRKKKRESTDTDSEETPDDVIVTGKRARKKIDVQEWSDSEEGEEDPFQTDDEEDEWQPSGNLDTQDTQDD